MLRSKVLFSPIVLSSLTLLAARQYHAPVKEGPWEVTVTHSMTGMPAAPNIPSDTLAKLPPEQSARIEVMMSDKPSTDVRKDCISKEKLEKHSAFTNNRGDCTRTIVSSTGSKLEMKFHCEEKQSSSDGTFLMEAIGSDNVKGTMHIGTNSNNAHVMTTDFTISSKYLGPDCGDVK